MTFSVYIIRNDINEKVYIGQTIKPIQTRFAQHCRGKSARLETAMQEIGPEHFFVELLDDSAKTKEELAEKETYYIRKYDSINSGYNSKIGMVSRPLAPLDDTARTSFKIPPELMEKLRQEAEAQNRSVHNMILTILKDYFSEKQ